MNEPLEDVKEILLMTLKGIQEKNPKLVKEWSDHVVHNSSIYQEEYLITTAVITYSLAKLLEKTKIEAKQKKQWQNFWRKISNQLKKSLNCIEKKEIKKCENHYNKIIKLIKEFDEHYSEHAAQILNQSKIKKAWKIHAHGVSLGRVAQLLKISEWELMNYLGITKTTEEFTDVNPEKRYKQFKKIIEQ